jgi:hypothetical protein
MPTATGSGSSPHENQYQIAYVTPDLDQAVTLLKERLGVTGFKGLSSAGPVVENTVTTPDGEVSIGMRVVIAIMGNLTLEVMQPVSGATGIFNEMIVPGQILRLHHLGMRCDDLQAMRAAHERAGRKVVMEGSYGAASFIYVDARETMGHFLEYACAPASYWDR